MEKLPEVEAARALMKEAMTWSVMKWLREKKKVRRTADAANAALDQARMAVQERWSPDLKAAYQGLAAKRASPPAPRSQAKPSSSSARPDTISMARNIHDADDEAYRARMDAEATFDEAERQLSTALAREGCRKAIHSWDLHEKAIRKAEAVIDLK